MRSHKIMVYMFIGMFLIQYFISSYIMANNIKNITGTVSQDKFNLYIPSFIVSIVSSINIIYILEIMFIMLDIMFNILKIISNILKSTLG